VLPAFQQTEDYLASFRILKQQLQQQQVAVSAAQRYFDIAFARYCSGVDTYLHVFTAQISLLSTQQTAVPVRIQQMTSGVILSRLSATAGIQPSFHLKKRWLQIRM
jgi:outer membrane protein TolC